jgi:hypothetical protein
VVPRRVRGYAWVGNAHQNHAAINQKMGLGSSGLLSTVDDLNRWSEALRYDRIISSASRASMLTPGKVGNGDVAWPEGMGTGYGLGVFLAGSPTHRIEKHSGSWGDASSQLTRFLDDDVTVIVLTNVGYWDQRMFAGESILELMTQGKFLPKWEAQPDPEPTRLKTIESLCLSVSRGTLDTRLVTDRVIKLLAIEHLSEPLKDVEPNTLKFVKHVPQGKSAVYIYRTESDPAHILWFLFQPDGKIAHLGSFPIVKA